MCVLLTQAEGESAITEGIYETRFKYVEDLVRMGADIRVDSRRASISGGKPMHGASVTALDLRAGVAMVIAGLIAKGTTTVNEIDHILRGYENIVEKLTGAGAKISIKETE
jgi:UDP-N-acetylglucosamine 1-carboxyvinyltransferase